MYDMISNLVKELRKRTFLQSLQFMVRIVFHSSVFVTQYLFKRVDLEIWNLELGEIKMLTRSRQYKCKNTYDFVNQCSLRPRDNDGQRQKHTHYIRHNGRLEVF
jgi:hypothetical protein